MKYTDGDCDLNEKASLPRRLFAIVALATVVFIVYAVFTLTGGVM